MTSNDATPTRRPTGLHRSLQRLPVPLYRTGLGRLMGNRHLLLVHIGRLTGRPRQTVLEVIHHDTEQSEWVVAAMWVPESDWYRNIQASPAVRVQVGSRRFSPEQRFVPPDQAALLLEAYRRKHPRWSRLGERYIKRPMTVTSMPLVAFREASRGD